MLRLMTLALLINIASAHARPLDWKISRQWNQSEEALFSEFVATLGAAIKSGTCSTTDNCLKNPKANPLFYRKNPRGLAKLNADCADFPYVLRAYFAFMRELPFVHPNGVTFYSPELEKVRKAYYEAKREHQSYNFFNRPMRVRRRYQNLKDRLEELQGSAGGDIRYSRSGNKITGLKKITGGEQFNSIYYDVVGSVSTAVFRVNAERFDTGNVFRDTYPVEIDKESIAPGTILYDPNGHIGVVAEVTDSGKIYLIDAHPDNSITYISYGEKFSRSSINIGAGFLKFRPYRLSNGRYTPTPNSQLRDYSLEQFQGTNLNARSSWKNATFTYNGQDLPFVQYVRANLSKNDLTIKPMEETKTMLGDLCRDFKDRATSVEAAVNAGLSRKAHPSSLPDNIYGTYGEWETYSTPSRDARLKASVQEIYETLAGFIGVGEASSFQIDYDGNDIKADVAAAYKKEAQKCVLDIKKSDGSIRKMSLREAISKLFDLSFDPYICPELRWGLKDDELKTCRQSQEKWDWYRALRPLRHQIQRQYDDFMGYSLRELPSSGLGVIERPDLDFEALL